MKNVHARKVVMPVFAAAVMGMVLWVNAGPLDPPVGPVLSTGRFGPRTEITALPFTISQPGSYFLADNLIGTTADNGITVDADDVTLDLNGFALIGEPGLSLHGVTISGTHKNLVVRNGTVRNWGLRGIHAFNATNSQFEKLRVSDNGDDGMLVGSGGTVANCTATGNTDEGIVARRGCTVVDSSAADNLRKGITAFPGCTVVNCTAFSNDREGIFVIDGSTVIGCTARDNGMYGIVADRGSTVSNCTSSSNTLNGIQVANQCRVVDNNCWDNSDRGINVLGDRNRLVGNVCNGNGVDGIRVAGDGNHLEGNTLTHASGANGAIVLTAGAAGNFIVKNIARGTVYSFNANNTYGAVITTPGPSFSGADPWANFRY